MVGKQEDAVFAVSASARFAHNELYLDDTVGPYDVARALHITLCGALAVNAVLTSRQYYVKVIAWSISAQRVMQT